MTAGIHLTDMAVPDHVLSWTQAWQAGWNG